MVVTTPSIIPEISDTTAITTWVVFSNDTDITFLKILKKGFRHCFVIMQQNDRWIVADPMAHKTDIQLLPHPKTFNVPQYYKTQGKTVMKMPVIETPKKIAWPWPISCVSSIKRMIGYHKWYVVTPHQLYKSLQKLSQKQ